MNVDFKTIDMNDKPVLVLQTPSGKVIQTLGYAHSLNCSFKFNETSQIEFEIPAYVEGVATPNYDKVVGEMLVDVVGWGVFVLQNPKVSNDGIKEIKTCTAYSREYELSHKQLFLEEGTYNFWNPASPEGTILWHIIQVCPGWKVGSVSPELVGKYRTFDTQQDNAYNIMMNGLQKPYKCVFYFDTYKRTINALDASVDLVTSPIYLSLENLVKKIDIEEKSENLVTVLDVNGADGVDIRMVNPTASNKIYNLDYFMNDTHFDQDVIDAWENWKNRYEERRTEYFSLSVRYAMKTSEILAKNAKKTDEEGELTKIESEQSVNIQASMNGDDTGHIALVLEELKKSATEQKEKIKATTDEIEVLEYEKDVLYAQLQSIKDEMSFDNFFTDDQLNQLYPYFIENALTEASFAITDTLAFTDTSMTLTNKTANITISDCNLMKIKPRDYPGGAQIDEQIYSFEKGMLLLTYSSTENDVFARYEMTCEIDRGTLEKSGTKFVMTAKLGSGAITNMSTLNPVNFTGGTFTIVGTNLSTVDDCMPDENVHNVLYQGKSIICSVTEADMYMTNETTMMEQYAVSWALYDYAQEELRKIAYPTYTFRLDTSNFLAMDDFIAFTRELRLGRRSYINTGDKVLKPILVGVDMSFDDLTDFSLTFSDTYHGSDNAFNLVDLLEQSVSMGHKLDASKFSYNDYINSGAKTAVHDFITGALDASKNAVVNGADQEIKLDESGLHLRKMGANGDYDDEQIWMINNNIVFTSDGWESAKMAFGHFYDENTGLDNWGLVAPSIVGTLLAGENLVIEAPKPSVDGGPSGRSLFRVDGNGASLYNSRIEIINPLNPTSDGTARFGNIMIDPEIGLGLGVYEGSYTSSTSDGDTVEGITQVNAKGVRKWNADVTKNGVTEEGRAKFWVDMDGNLHFKGKLEGADGTFSGKLRVGDPDGEKTGTPKGVYLDSEGNLAIGGIYSPEDELNREPKANFFVDNMGHMFAKSGNIEGDMYVNNLYFKDPAVDGWSSVLDDHKKIKSQYIDLGNIILDGKTGNVKILGNIDLGEASAINFGTFQPGIEYEYSEDGTDGSWHTERSETDVYVRTVVVTDSIDEDGDPVKVRTPSGDVQVLSQELPKYIKATHIDMTQVSSPSFLGNNMYSTSFNVVDHFLTGSDGHTTYGNIIGAIGQINGSTGYHETTTGVGIGRDSNHYVICTDAGVRMQCGIYNPDDENYGTSLYATIDRCAISANKYATIDVTRIPHARGYSASMYCSNGYDGAGSVFVKAGIGESGTVNITSYKDANYKTGIFFNGRKISITSDYPNYGWVDMYTGHGIYMSVGTGVYMTVRSSGGSDHTFNFTSSGMYETSDENLKENISYEINGDLVDELRPAKFNYKGNRDISFGFIAQDVEVVIPDVVDNIQNEKNGESHLGLNYLEFIPFLTAKIQKQTKQIRDLEERITELEKRGGE